ncbi:MAG: hypothetical protein IE922_16845, partial [Sphingomonadales bacterium]|nr:hypothetical protein [Sphingomonadales bacterium]
MKLTDPRVEWRLIGRIDGVGQPAVAVLVGPGVDIEIGGDGHHPGDPLQTRRDERREHTAPAVTDEGDVSVALRRQQPRNGPRQALD